MAEAEVLQSLITGTGAATPLVAFMFFMIRHFMKKVDKKDDELIALGSKKDSEVTALYMARLKDLETHAALLTELNRNSLVGLDNVGDTLEAALAAMEKSDGNIVRSLETVSESIRVCRAILETRKR